MNFFAYFAFICRCLTNCFWFIKFSQIFQLEKKLAVEVDGRTHKKDRDAIRDSFLRKLGWKVLRFSNEAVTERLEECVQTVLSTISK